MSPADLLAQRLTYCEFLPGGGEDSPEWPGIATEDGQPVVWDELQLPDGAGEAASRRLVECWNALLGVADPAASLAALVVAAEHAFGVLVATHASAASVVGRARAGLRSAVDRFTAPNDSGEQVSEPWLRYALGHHGTGEYNGVGPAGRLTVGGSGGTFCLWLNGELLWVASHPEAYRLTRGDVMALAAILGVSLRFADPSESGKSG